MNSNIYDLLNLTKNEEELTDAPLSDMEVNSLMKRFHNKNNNIVQKMTSKKRRIVAAVISAAAVTALIPASVYAYSRISASIQKTAPYQNTVRIESLADKSTTDATPVSEGYMTWSLGYLPEGYVQNENGLKFHNAADGSGISPCLYRIPETMDNFEINLRYSATCENYESNGKTAMINYRAGYNESDNISKEFGREVWICFDNTRYVLQLYIGNGVSKDDLYKIIDNASLVPSDVKTYAEHFDWLKESGKPDKEYVKSENSEKSDMRSVSPEECNVVPIGETGSCKTPDGYADCSFRINSAEITDSFEGINTDACGYNTDYSEYMDENGNVLPNTRTWFKYGNGVDTLNEDIGSYEMPFHILKLNVTASNDTDKYKEICISPELISFTSDSVPTPFEIDENVPEGYEDLRYVPDGYSPADISYRDSLFNKSNKKYLGRNEFFSFNTDEAHMGGKNYIKLNAGESADFEICFMISDNNIGKTYLMFYSVNSLSQSLRNGYPLYDLTGIKSR